MHFFKMGGWALAVAVAMLLGGCERQVGPDYEGYAEQLRTESEPSDLAAIDELISYQVRALNRKVYYERRAGLRMLEDRHWSEAAKHLEAAQAIKQDDVELHNALGICYANMGRYHPAYLERAAAEYRAAIELRPEKALSYYGLGAVCYYQGDTASATEALQQCVTLDPLFGRGHLFLGKIAYEDDDLAGALRHYTTALELYGRDDNRAQIMFNIGETYARMNNRDNALNFMAQALELDPHNQRFQERYQRYREQVS